MMRRLRTTSITPAAIALSACLLMAPGLEAQAPGPVSYAQIVDHTLHQSVQLPGVVESRTGGLVASEVAGLVVEMPALPGQHVKRGQALVRLRDVTLKLQLRAAEGDLDESRARLDLAERQLKRARDLFADSVISQDEMDDAVSENTAWLARVDRAVAQVELLKVALDRTVIRAPYDGVVLEKHTEVGQWVQQGGPVAEMTSLAVLDVRVEVPERFYDLLALGTNVPVALDAVPDLELAGKLHRIIPRADPQARSFPVTVAIRNPDGRVAVGMLARAALPVGETRSALLVPKDAVIQSGVDHSLYRIKSDNTVEPVPVTPGQGVGQWIVVQGAISVGDKVVTRGNERLRPGQAVAGQLQEYPRP